MHRKLILLAAAFILTLPLTAQFKTTSDQVKEHVDILASDSLLGRGFGSPQGLKAANYIAEQFAMAGIDALDGKYLHPFIHREGILNIAGNNVIGVIRGNDPELQEEYILLGAHYDHLGWKIRGGDTVVYNGADDNASGSASIIEIGRNLVERKSELGRTVILVAFDGEESGLLGSKQFLSDSVLPPHQVKLMFSLDMIGMLEAHNGLDMKGVRLLHDADYLVGELAEKYNLNITKANDKIEQRTDTAPFGKIGIPAIAPNTGTESPYHKPEDTREKLDYDGMAQVANYMSDVSLYLSSQETLSDMIAPQEGEVAGSSAKTFRAGVRLNMGSGYHRYKDQFYRGKDIFAISAGVLASIRLSDHFKLQPELLYESTGSQHSDGVYRSHSLTTPVNIQVLTSEEEFVRSYLQLGGYYSYHFAGNIAGTAIDFDNSYNRNEFGITIGVGMEVMEMVQLGFYFQLGLSDLNQLSDNRIMQESIYFQLGFIF